DEAIGSRLREMAKGQTVTLAGGMELNYRLR
ncbi:ATP-binding protein, partial [Acinetobacter baumannii]|nr:ATP-binding protein [Acinetobacter baumannii]